MRGLLKRPGLVAAAFTLIIAAAAVFHFAGAPAAHQEGAGAAGRSLMAAGEYERAAQSLRAAWRADPSEEGRLDLARALLASGDFAGVIDLLQKTDENAQTGGRATYLRAEAMLRSARYGEAEALAEDLRAARPTDGQAMLLAARALYGLGDMKGAAAALGEALRAGGALGQAWLLRAHLAFDAGDAVAAKAAIARAQEAGASLRETTIAEAEFALRQGDLEGARALLGKLSPARKNRMQAVDLDWEFLAARLDAASGDYKTAARRIRLTGPFLLGEPHGALVAALIQERAGDRAQAEALFRRAQDAAPKDAALLDGFAGFLIRAGRYEDADPVIDALTEIAPHRGALARMQIAEARGDDNALFDLAKGAPSSEGMVSALTIAFGPASKAAQREAATLRLPEALISGETVLRSGAPRDMRAAIANLQAFPDAPPALTLQGDLLLALGEDAQAQARYRRAVASAPELKAARLGLLRVDIRGGDIANLESRLFAALARDQNDSFARLALARALRGDKRYMEASAMLEPMSAELASSPREAVLYANLLKAAGAKAALAGFAVQVRRARPGSALAAELFAAAGRPDDASLAAREALLLAPADKARAERYVNLMQASGRDAEAKALLAALLRRAPDAEGAKAALARLEGAPAAAPSEKAPEDEAATSLAEAARAYREDPTNPDAASRFGMTLTAGGDERAGIRLSREACFWSSEAECPYPMRSGS